MDAAATVFGPAIVLIDCDLRSISLLCAPRCEAGTRSILSANPTNRHDFDTLHDFQFGSISLFIDIESTSTMGRKDKIKRSKKMLSIFTEEELKEVEQTVAANKAAQAKYLAIGQQIDAIFASGLPISKYNRELRGTKRPVTPADLMLDVLVAQLQKLKDEITKYQSFLAELGAEKMKKMLDDMDKKDPPAGGSGGGMAV